MTRIFAPNAEGKSRSTITTYHSNGLIYQELKIVNGRARGKYREWHPNGELRLDVLVLEGMGELDESSQLSWIFDGMNKAWDEAGNLLAEINYEKGVIQGKALYYHTNGTLKREIPYENGMIHGEVGLFDEEGIFLGRTDYVQGKVHGLCTFRGNKKLPPFTEKYEEGLLMSGLYLDFEGNSVASIENGFGSQAHYEEGKLSRLVEYQRGEPEGKVLTFDKWGKKNSSVEMSEGLRHGNELHYYPNGNRKMQISWHRDEIQGVCRTWYTDGILESEKEMRANQKNGVSSAYYIDGSLMLLEEYENDTLKQGSYRMRGDDRTISTVEDGEGTATLHEADGTFLRTVQYEEGQPYDGS